MGYSTNAPQRMRPRGTAGSYPAWRAAMSATNTLYEIGGDTSNAGTEIVWPDAGANNYQMTGGTDNNAYRMHHGYGGSVFVPDLGAFGTMVFGTTGEAIITHQLTRFTLSDDAPAWRMFQQPTYPISEAEAVTMGADLYYSPADFAALPADRKVPANETGFATGWDEQFPVGYENWVIRRKLHSSLVGNSTPHFFRYDMPVCIPAAMTGTGASAIIVTNWGTIHGPFSQGIKPIGVTDSQWFADLASGAQQFFLYAMNTQTGAWQRLSSALPTGWGTQPSIKLPHACVDEANKRIYYWGVKNSANRLLYADFASGLASMSFVEPSFTDLTGGAQPAFSSNTVLCVPQSGALAGKRLWYCKDSTGVLLMIDIDNLTMRRLTITGLPPVNDNFWNLAYDPAANIVYITIKGSAFGVQSYRFSIPDDYTNQSAYSIPAPTAIALNGVTLEAAADSGLTFPHGARSRYHPELGVILLTQRNNKMLAFRP